MIKRVIVSTLLVGCVALGKKEEGLFFPSSVAASKKSLALLVRFASLSLSLSLTTSKKKQNAMAFFSLPSSNFGLKVTVQSTIRKHV